MVKTIQSAPVRSTPQMERTPAQSGGRVTGAGGRSFDAILQEQVAAGELRFSRHAAERMASRNIRVSESDLARMRGAVEHAAARGMKDSLLVVDRHAFIVSVENRTVVTALDRSSMRDQLFTNIDSAVLL